MYNTGDFVLIGYSVYVSASDHILPYQFEQRILGNQRSCYKEDKEGILPEKVLLKSLNMIDFFFCLSLCAVYTKH